jgi:AraC family transcriptional regulator
MHLKMKPKIVSLTEKKLIGKKVKMSFSDNKTVELWHSFIPRRREIRNGIGAELYSVEVYNPQFFDNFNPDASFDKWAAIEVTDFKVVPDEMETLTLPGGAYAVFLHKGTASEGPKTYSYIFETWLPDSGFSLDNRPHFALMGEKYKNDNPDSEEELWIPVKPKE